MQSSTMRNMRYRSLGNSFLWWSSAPVFFWRRSHPPGGNLDIVQLDEESLSSLSLSFSRRTGDESLLLNVSWTSVPQTALLSTIPMSRDSMSQSSDIIQVSQVSQVESQGVLWNEYKRLYLSCILYRFRRN